MPEMTPELETSLDEMMNEIFLILDEGTGKDLCLILEKQGLTTQDAYDEMLRLVRESLED